MSVCCKQFSGQPAGQRPGRALAAGCVALALCASLVSPAAAEPREAVGAIPIVLGERLLDPRGDAVQAALREAVIRVAEELLLDAPEELEVSLDEVLGRNLVPYASNFRMIEDRGPRPLLFSDHPDAESEYVVIVEVDVDEERLREQLVQAGLLAADLPARALALAEIEVVGIERYGAYEALRTLLIKKLGVRSVAPRELEHGRAILGVLAHATAAELVARAVEQSDAILEIVPLHGRGERPRIAVRWDEAAAMASGGSASVGRR